MIELKQNVSAGVWARIKDATGAPVTGILFGAVAATVWKNDGTTVDLILTALDWTEVTGGAFAGSGTYILTLPGSSLDQVGRVMYGIKVGTNDPYIGAMKVIANEEAETKVEVDTLLGIGLGKWTIAVTGADANRLILYAQDGVTVIKKFSLKDAAGDPTFINPFSREPI